MGTKIDPPPPGEPCPLCWGTNFDPFGIGPPPRIIQVRFSGIMTGAAWTPSDIPPPNGMWSSEPDGSCAWVPEEFPGFQLDYSPVRSLCWFFADAFGLAFRATPDDTCVQDFVNELTDPSDKYYGGSAHVFV